MNLQSFYKKKLTFLWHHDNTWSLYKGNNKNAKNSCFPMMNMSCQSTGRAVMCIKPQRLFSQQKTLKTGISKMIYPCIKRLIGHIHLLVLVLKHAVHSFWERRHTSDLCLAHENISSIVLQKGINHIFALQRKPYGVRCLSKVYLGSWMCCLWKCSYCMKNTVLNVRFFPMVDVIYCFVGPNVCKLLE